MAQQLGNTANGSIPAQNSVAQGGEQPPVVTVAQPAPVRAVNSQGLLLLGQKYRQLFMRYQGERMPAEQKWLKNLRQYLGIYDPEIERTLDAGRSRAYPRLTRMKCVSMLSRLMNLMFPGNEDNWELGASPSPEMDPADVARAVQMLVEQLKASGQPVAMSAALIEEAVRALADEQAAQMTELVKDQLLELGGHQSIDWIALNRKVVDSGVKFGIGVLEGPYLRAVQQSGWAMTDQGAFQPINREVYKPQYDFLPVWDFYPDMSARELPGEGYFVRKVLGRSALRKLADRPDFFAGQIKHVITQLPGGNFQAKAWETELRSMGLSNHAQSGSTQASGREKYEVIVWKGPVSATTLRECGVEVPDEMMADDVMAEMWMVENYVIKAEINAWRKLGVDMRTVHVFSFDEDDTSPIGQGLPGIMRDTQMSLCAVTRMTLDNASVTCGPQFEINTRLMQANQDISTIAAYRNWYRDDDDPVTTQYPAIRQIQVDGHIGELEGLIKLFMEFGEIETFIGPSTGGDMSRMPSEPMRTAAGASMLRGDAALPFKDIVRNYDTFTQSVIWSMVEFNRKFNPDMAPGGDYNVVPRGATSLIAKEVRGMQIDTLSQTLTPEDMDHIDQRRFIEAKFASRDLQGLLVSEDQARRNKEARAQVAAEAQQLQNELATAEVKKTAAEAYKNITQGQKNVSSAEGAAVKSALELAAGANNGDDQGAAGGGAGAGAGGGKTA